MNQLLVSTLLGLWLTGVAHAQVRAASITLQQDPTHPDASAILVSLLNDGSAAATLARVDLQVRDSAEGEWRTVKTWDTDATVAAHQHLGLSFSPSASGFLDPMVNGEHYQLRAVVTAVGGSPVASAPQQTVPLDTSCR